MTFWPLSDILLFVSMFVIIIIHKKRKMYHSSDLTCFHELLRNSSAVNMPSNKDQCHGTQECQEEDFEQLKLEIVER